MKPFLLFLIIVIMLPTVSATVQVDSSDVFRITNLDISFGSTQTFDNIDTGNGYVNFSRTNPINVSTSGNFRIIPLTNLNITIISWNVAGDYSKTFIASSAIHNNPTTFVIGDFPPNAPIQVFENSVFSNIYTSDGLGYITFAHNTYSDVTIEALLAPSAIEAAACPGVNSDINAAFGLIGVLLIVFAAGMLISGIRSMNYPFMIVGIGAAITGAIMIIVGYFITVTISNGVGCLG